MHYLIDAYNLLFRIGEPTGHFESKRQHLVEAINTISVGTKLRITLVFDGAEAPPSHPTRHHFDTVELIYTPKGLSADEFIVNAVELTKRPERMTVVSSDRELTRKCRLHRAHVMKVEDFFLLIEKKRQKQIPSKPEEISSAELKRWLKIFEERLTRPT